jgi:hypothetical protein
MPAHGHATTWKLPLGIGRARDVRGWYHELKERWEVHKAARREARLAALTARWDAKREAVRSPHADAALDMVAATHAFSTTTTFGDLTL